jgi:hypothetical protein
MKSLSASPALMISRPMGLSGRCLTRRRCPATRRPTLPTLWAGINRMHFGAVADTLEKVVEEDRVGFAGVRPPQHDQVGRLDLFVRRGAASDSGYCRQTGDARSMSSSIAAVDVVTAYDDSSELLCQIVHFVGRLRTAEHAESGSAFSPRPAAAASNASSHVAGVRTPWRRTYGVVSPVLRFATRSPPLRGEATRFEG